MVLARRSAPTTQRRTHPRSRDPAQGHFRRIGKLAQFMIHGLRTEQELFPTPPVPPDDLQANFDTYVAACEAATEASGVAARLYTEKDEALDELAADMKTVIHHGVLGRGRNVGGTPSST